MKKILLAAGLTALMGTTSAFAQQIGASIARFDDNGLTIMRNGMTAHADSLDGVSLQMEDATDDVAKQLDQINNFIASSVDAIIVNAVDTNATEAMSHAVASVGVPLVYINRLRIIIIQVAIVGIIAIGLTQVIITAGIDLTSGSVLGATAMICMGFAQVAVVNGNPNPKAIFGPALLDLSVIVPVMVGLAVGVAAGIINGILLALARIPPFIATLGMMLFARGVAQWWSQGNPVSFPTEAYAVIGKGMNPVFIFLGLAVLFHFVMNYTV